MGVDKVGWQDIVEINHPVISGTGKVVEFRLDTGNHIKVEIIDAILVETGLPIKKGRMINITEDFLTVIERYVFPELKIEPDNFIVELMESEDNRIPVVDPNVGFVGNWK